MICLFLLWACTLCEQGRSLYQQSRFHEANRVLRAAAKKSPANEQVRLLLGYSLVALDRLDEALPILNSVEKRMAGDPEFLFTLSEAYTRRARQLADRISAKGQRSARARQHLGYRYRAAGEFRKALTELRAAAELRPSMEGIHLDAAEILWEQKEYEQAARALESELAYHPNNFLANLRYGQYLIRQNEYARAVQALEKAARFNRYPEAFQLLAFALRQLKRPDEAAAVVRAGLQIFAEDPGLREMTASSSPWRYTTLTASEPQEEQLRAAAATNPDDEDALFELTKLYSLRGEDLANRLREIAPNSVRVLQIEAIRAEQAGDLDRAGELYSSVLREHPEVRGLHYALGHVLRLQGKREAALAAFTRELERDPNHYLAHFEVGALELEQGDAKAAMTSLRRSTELAPSFVEASVQLAKAAIQLRDTSAAIAALRRAILQQPHHPSAHFLMYRALSLAGQPEEAAKEIRLHQQLQNGKQQ